MAQHAIHALALGCLYALLAAGLAFLSRSQRAWYLAYGGLYVVGAYATWWALRSRCPLWIALMLAPLLCVMLSLLLIGIERLSRVRHSERAQLLWGLGILICSMEICRSLMGAYHRKLLAIDSHQIYHLGPLMLSDMHWLLFGCAFGCGVCLHGLMTTSRAGMSLQAVLEGRYEPRPWRGLDPRLFAVAVGASLAGLAGGLAALYLNGVHPELGLRAMHKILCVVMIGGLGHIRGAVVAAFALAGVEGMVAPMTSDLPLPVESYLLLALWVVGLWPRVRPAPHGTHGVLTGRHREVTVDSV